MIDIDSSTPMAEATVVHVDLPSGQGTLFPLVTRHGHVTYTRSDGGPLTSEDFDLLTRLTRTATTRKSG